MAAPTVTYTFSPNTVAASAQVNQNFTDLINYLTNRDNGSVAWGTVNATNYKKSGFTGIIPLQVVIAGVTATFNTANTGFTATNLTGAITPQSTSSNILVFATGSFGQDTATKTAYVTIYRAIGAGGATNLISTGDLSMGHAKANATGFALQLAPVTLIAYDGPGSTSAITYTVRVSTDSGGHAYFGDGENQALVMIELL